MIVEQDAVENSQRNHVYWTQQRSCTQELTVLLTA